MEVNGGIFLHFDAEGREPFWNPRIHKQVTDGSWVYHGHCTHYINAHIQVCNKHKSLISNLGNTREWSRCCTF